MGRISLMMMRQREFLNGIVDLQNLSTEEKAALTKEYLLRLYVKVSEVYDAAKLKSQQAVELSPEERAHMLEEIINCFKYMLNLLLVHNFSLEEFEEMFHTKTGLVAQRQGKRVV